MKEFVKKVRVGDKSKKPHKTLFAVVGMLSFTALGLLFSLHWAIKYIYSRASEIHFLSDRLGEITVEYLTYVITVIGLVLMNANLTVLDIQNILITVALMTLGFGLSGFFFGRWAGKIIKY